jgi:hypothetical protein
MTRRALPGCRRLGAAQWKIRATELTGNTGGASPASLATPAARRSGDICRPLNHVMDARQRWPMLPSKPLPEQFWFGLPGKMQLEEALKRLISSPCVYL